MISSIFFCKGGLHSISVLLLYILPCCLIAQDYKSAIIPLEVNPNASNLVIGDDEFIVRTLNYIGEQPGTSILKIDLSFELVEKVDIINSFFSEDSPLLVDGNYYALELDLTMPASQFLVKYDTHFVELSKKAIVSTNGTTSVLSLLKQNEGFIASIWNRTESARAKINLIGVSENGEEITNSIHDADEPYLFSYELIESSDQNILFGTNLYSQGSFAGVYKLTSQGGVLWKYESSDEQSRGNVPVYVAELTDGNIVYTDKVDRQDLWPQNYNDNPARIGWLTPEGDSLREHIMLVPRNDVVELYGIKVAKNGTGFYIYGDQSYGTYGHGVLTKISNTGEVLWDKKILHETAEVGFHVIRDIEELPNGDIVTLGSITTPGNDPSTEIWMMRLNEHGCFGTETCSDEPIYTATSDIEVEQGAVLLYPNPTDGTLYIANEYISDISTYSINTTAGRVVIKDSPIAYGKIDVSALESGVYVVTLTGADGAVYSQQVVKEF